MSYTYIGLANSKFIPKFTWVPHVIIDIAANSGRELLLTAPVSILPYNQCYYFRNFPNGNF